jgi:hypothetical protein
VWTIQVIAVSSFASAEAFNPTLAFPRAFIDPGGLPQDRPIRKYLRLGGVGPKSRVPERPRGRIDIHISQIIAAARWAKPEKWIVRRS